MENGVYRMLMHMKSNDCEDPLLDLIPPPSKLFSSPSFNQRSGGNISRTNGTSACSSKLFNLSKVPPSSHTSFDSERFATASSRYPLDCPASTSTSFANDNQETKELDRKSSSSTTSQRFSYDLFLHKLKQSVYRSVEDVRLVEPKYISINGYKVPCLVLNGEPYVPMSACLRKIFRIYKEDEIFLLIEDLHIALLPALENEAKLLQNLDDVCALDALHNMYLMSRSDIERILGQVRICSRPTPYDDIPLLPGESICVSHHSYPEIVFGFLYPSRAGGCCILCAYTDCGNWFTPEDFVCHTHSTEIEQGIVHWGLHSNNWQFLLQVDGSDRGSEIKKKAFEDFKARRRPAPLEEQVLGIFRSEAQKLKDDRKNFFLSGYDGTNYQEELEMALIKQCSLVELEEAYSDLPVVTSVTKKLLLTKKDVEHEKAPVVRAPEWGEWQEKEHTYNRSISDEARSEDCNARPVTMHEEEAHEETEEKMRIQMINMTIQHQANALRERTENNILKNQLTDAKDLYAELYDKEQLCGLNQLGKMISENSGIMKYLQELSSASPDPGDGQLAMFLRENEVHKHSNELSKACDARNELKMFDFIKTVEKDLLQCNTDWMLLLHQFLEITKLRMEKVKEHMSTEKYKFLLLYDYANTLCLLANEGTWPTKSFTRMFVPSFLTDPQFINQGLHELYDGAREFKKSLKCSEFPSGSQKFSCEPSEISSSHLFQRANPVTCENGVPTKRKALDSTSWDSRQSRFSPISPASISPTLKRKSIVHKKSDSSDRSVDLPKQLVQSSSLDSHSFIATSTGNDQNFIRSKPKSSEKESSWCYNKSQRLSVASEKEETSEFLTEFLAKAQIEASANPIIHMDSLSYSSAFKSCVNPIRQCNGDASILHPIAVYPNQTHRVGGKHAVDQRNVPCWTNQHSLENKILNNPSSQPLHFAQQSFQTISHEKLSTFIPQPKPIPEFASTVMSYPPQVLEYVLNPPPQTQGGSQNVHQPSQPPSVLFNFDPTLPGILHPR